MAPRINIPPITRALLLSLFLLTISNIALRPISTPTLLYLLSPFNFSSWIGAPFLCIVPGVSIVYPWVFFTATLVEQNIWGLAISGFALFFGGRYLERAWGGAEFAKFVLFVAVIPNLVAFGTCVVWYALTHNTGALTTTISGTTSLAASALVSLTQLIPEHTITLLSLPIRIRIKRLPSIFLLIQTLSMAILGSYPTFLLAISGFLTSWTYLRFYRKTEIASAASTDSTLVRGDASETFAFAAFFPEVVQPPIAAASDAIYNILVTLRLCAPFSADAIDSANEAAIARSEGGLPNIMNPAGGSGARRGSGSQRREEAERRRQLALKALDQRLHAAASRGAGGPQMMSTSAPAPARVASTSSPAEAEPEGKGKERAEE
ncbi:DUF1751-domain-containing protein [Aulographum hederae CBS 113979]|uniref:DUF1751-domain-containing protein n=1 Tax=Aulographum hederae CBS 113979 TaxID=1176131 RepID=A0A6G1HE89_9PEZI|nr:DUF1751-domain-containing protein [Aulographum hederae CBS 113979]